MTAESDESMQHMASESPTARQGQDPGALDAWLHRALADRFDATLEEALPAEMTNLLSGLH